MLTKEVKEILEGIHFFLVEGLKDESLSGKVECLRRGLLMQIEGLRTVYPFLQFGSSVDPNANIRGSSTAISYLNVESQNANSSLMSTSSSSSINYSSTGCSNGSSSTGYSGDGIVTSPNNNNSFGGKSAVNYEDFEDIESCSDITTTTTMTTQSPRRRSSADLLSGDFLEERDEESYAEGVEPVSFRILVGKCNHHGVLSKRSKSILPGVRNSKTFRCVLVGSLLYFYLKESDDKQKKVIDLNWYSLHESPSEDNKSYSRRKEFTFQLMSCDGKKTHTFFTSKKTSMERWIRCIRQAVSTSQERLIRSQKAPLIQHDENLSQTENDDDDDEDEEFYEELNGEVLRERYSPRETSKLWKPPLVPFQHRAMQPKSADISDYYSVPEEVASQIQKHIYYNQQKKVPPERPPLPNILRDSLKRNRPLPQAPESLEGVDEGPEKYTEDEIYCEIDEQLKIENNFRNSMSEIDSSSLSKEIFDTINSRVPSTQEKSFLLRQNAVSASDENYDVPSDASSCPSWRLTQPSLLKVPSLPPKGTFSSQISDEDSEYKVPSATVRPESLYNVPSNLPVSVKAVEERLSGRYDNSILSDESINEPISDKTVSDCVNNNQQSASEDVKVCKESEEISKDDDINTDLDHEKTGFEEENRSKTDEESKVNPSNSVKDLIAKLNQARDSAETSQKPLYYSSFRESKLSVSGFDNSFLVECKNKIEVSRSVKSIKDNLEKEKLKLSLSDTRGTNQLRKREETSSNDSMGTELCSKQSSQIKINLGTLNACSTQEDRVYIAKFAFVSNSPNGLSFNRGDEMVVKDYPSEERLWRAVIKGREGFVPKEYLRKKDTE